MEPVRMGIIGTGIAARDLHLPALRELQDKLRIVAVCNRSEETGRSFASLAGNVYYTPDYEALLSLPDVEAVDIVLPVGMNYSVTLAALQAGKHVIVEKPLAANLEEAGKMLTFPYRFPDRVMMVAENFRYFPVLGKVRQYIEDGIIGTPYAVNWVVYTRNALTNKYVKTPWRIDHQYPGGFITDAGVHYIAGLRHILGDFVSGCAITQSINPLIGELDTLSFQFLIRNDVQKSKVPSLRNEGEAASLHSGEKNAVQGMARNWEDGSIEIEMAVQNGTSLHNSPNTLQGTLHLFYSAYGIYEDTLIIFGDLGTIIASTGEGERRVTVKRPGNQDLVDFFDTDRGYRGEFDNFAEAIRNGKEVSATFSQSYRDLEILLAVQDAARENRRVTF